MSHRKYKKPRHGSLAFLPRKRAARPLGRTRAFPMDDTTKPPHLTAFVGYKAGMTHIMREVDRSGSKMHKREIVEAVTILETPPMICVGMVGYQKTPKGLVTITTVWASHLAAEFKRRLYKKWYKSKKKAFSKYQKKMYQTGKFDQAIELLKERSEVIRAICHTQPSACGLKMKKSHIVEVQVNGGEISHKVDFVKSLFEQKVAVNSVFSDGSITDIVGVTKGKGLQGVIKRWGVTRLPRKTHRGRRRVACIGAWHPARVQYSIGRHGQMGYHNRTELNKRIYRVGFSGDPANASTVTDLTEKTITPIGGFPHYGSVKSDFLMIKGSCPGTQRRPLTLRIPVGMPTRRAMREDISLRFIDTASKVGHGRFQTAAEKRSYFGATKQSLAGEELSKT